ncbi:MAG: twin-arginine translocase TatA/TatE family subunit [Verrucomicrobiales bacterium]|nr:twin-arginine translocase TatA/TatE family subunit [Verrucomicrobiales bacterium]|tara:strand:- start:1412 stop:1621 length:210 start_codon:yes stop_codon:yes gene_type:complete
MFTHTLLGVLQYPEIIMIIVLVLIMFGAKKLPELARGMGQGIREFRNASRDIQNDLERTVDPDGHDHRR